MFVGGGGGGNETGFGVGVSGVAMESGVYTDSSSDKEALLLSLVIRLGLLLVPGDRPLLFWIACCRSALRLEMGSGLSFPFALCGLRGRSLVGLIGSSGLSRIGYVFALMMVAIPLFSGIGVPWYRQTRYRKSRSFNTLLRLSSNERRLSIGSKFTLENLSYETLNAS